MKRLFAFIVISLAIVRLPLMAQDSSGTAAAIAARQEADENYKRMAADLQAVQADNVALHAKISTLEQEIQTLRDAAAKPVDNSAIQDDLKKLVGKIQEVDKKRLEDKDAIAEEIRKAIGGIESNISHSPAPTPHEPRGKPVQPTEPNPAAENGYSYTIQSGDTLGEILKAYNKDFKSKGLKPITIKQAMEANPTVDWKRLLVGQKIIIPRPAGS